MHTTYDHVHTHTHKHTHTHVQTHKHTTVKLKALVVCCAVHCYWIMLFLSFQDPNPVACPNGTYSNLTGLKSVEQCLTCPPGKYCSPPGLTAPAGDCAPGHYCPNGTSFDTQFPCPVSYYLANSSAESVESCTLCISGHYCDEEGLGTPKICPVGSYCQIGLSVPDRCPPGTYSNLTGLTRPQECLPCPGGYYCEGSGNTQPTGPCSAGYYCRYKAETATPIDEITGGICPRGGYCPEGSSIQANCPPGTYGNATGNRAEEDCVECDAGFYCSGDNNPAPTGICAAGCYCPGGSSRACQIPVIPGSFSGPGQANYTPCHEGFFQQVDM